MRIAKSCTLLSWLSLVLLSFGFLGVVSPQPPPGEHAALGEDRLVQAHITSGQLSLEVIQRHGLTLFATPFNKVDGYGDGPMNPDDPIIAGGRPTLQDNGTLLRVNGLDAQACLECHAIASMATIPFTFGVGGVGSASANVLFQPTLIDVGDTLGARTASFDGRFINPPFVFGAGGVELVAKEMTAELQTLKALAQHNPGTDVVLVTKGVHFGSIRYDAGRLDTTRVEGIDADLVVRPFGRKGAFATTRAFAVGAMIFHFGMQPVELVGEDVDADGDGVVNEVRVGELSALSIFMTTLPRPTQEALTPAAQQGLLLFQELGCADCHKPFLQTDSRYLPYSFPEVPTAPFANIFYTVDLSAAPSGFTPASDDHDGGLVVPLFADLKRHDMGPQLAETTGAPLDAYFTTARLWGVADTAPYLHDGRAFTLTEAILLHGGEAEAARQAFANLPDEGKVHLLAFLRSLRTPIETGR